jgi:hypothetical protein
MQNRIDRLESLVLSLMTNGAQSAGPVAAAAAIAHTGSLPTDSISGSSAGYPLDLDRDDMIKEEVEGQEEMEGEVDRLGKSIGVMKVDSNKNLFISEAHWYSILAEVSFRTIHTRLDHLVTILTNFEDYGSQELLCRKQKAVRRPA